MDKTGWVRGELGTFVAVGYAGQCSIEETLAQTPIGAKSGNYCRSLALLTDAQSQGTKVASTAARDGKI